MSPPAKIWYVTLCIFFLLSVFSCGGTGSGSVGSEAGVKDVCGNGDCESSTKKAEWGFFAISQAGNPLDSLTNVKWSRITGMIWSKLQNIDGGYNWEFMDEKVQKAQANNYNLVFVLKTGNSELFSDPDCYEAAKKSDSEQPYLHSCPIIPDYEDDWKDLIFNIIERYDRDGVGDMPGLNNDFELDIQIENEAGNPTYWYLNERTDGVKAAEEYIKILRLAYEAKEHANPSTNIIVPGFIQPDKLARCEKDPLDEQCSGEFFTRNRDFTEKILQYPQYFDALDVHFFNYFMFDTQYIEDGIKYFNEKMAGNGYSRPIYSLEWTGSIMLMISKSNSYKDAFYDHFPYSNDFSTIDEAFGMYKNLSAPENRKYRVWFEAEQAVEFPKLFTTMLVNGVERLIYVQFHDYYGAGWDNVWWNWQGIVKYEGSFDNPVLIKKPGYYTYKILSEKIYGFDSYKVISGSPDIFYAYEFTFKSKEPVYVLWTEDSSGTVDLSNYISSPTVTITHIVTELDNNNPVYPDDEIVSTSAIPVTGTPVFVEAVQ